jgi:hypothetical protein
MRLDSTADEASEASNWVRQTKTSIPCRIVARTSHLRSKRDGDVPYRKSGIVDDDPREETFQAEEVTAVLQLHELG